MEELLGRVSSLELTEWAAFEREYGPLGPARGDWQAALVAHTIAAANGVDSKLPDFVLKWGRRGQTDDERLTLFQALASGGGRGDDR